MAKGITLTPCGLIIERIEPGPDALVIIARPTSETAACPTCGQHSSSIHSRSTRCGFPGLSNSGTVQSLGGSGRHRKLLRWFAARIKQMAKSGSERAIVDRATNLKNRISAAP